MSTLFAKHLSSSLLFGNLIIFPLYWKVKHFSQFYGKNKSMKEVFAERLKELRLERGLGQVQLAKELDVGKSVVSLWELGKCEPTLSKLIAMARFFGVSIDYLAWLED